MKDYLAIWAAFLSTLLAAIRIWETWKRRSRLEATYSFAGDPQVGNEIIIQNPSDSPAMVSYWELLWAHRTFPRLKPSDGIFPDDGLCNITIGPHSTHTLSFREDRHFPWGSSAQDKGNLYLRLHVVGRRKPVTLLVYKPNQ